MGAKAQQDVPWIINSDILQLTDANTQRSVWGKERQKQGSERFYLDHFIDASPNRELSSRSDGK